MQTFKIQRLGHQGDGVAQGPVFAPLTLPGEEVSGDLDGTRLENVRIVRPSVDRVAAPCSHFKSCGGCQLQHARDEYVEAWKVDVVRIALAAQGLETEFLPIQTSPTRSRRRASFSAHRTKKGAMVGFHARNSATIIPISDCHLLDPALLASKEIIEELTVIGGSRKGELNALVTLSEAGVDIAISNAKPLDDTLRIELAQVAAKHGLARLSWDKETVAQNAPPFQKFGRTKVTPPPGAFLQATPHGQDALVACVEKIIGSANHVIDLFSGCGTFALPLTQTAEVHAVEGDAEMVAAMVNGWRQAGGLKLLTSEARDLFRRPLLAEDLRKFEAAVIDPPRAGAEAQIEEIAKSTIQRIAFVSCNPVTFAKDAKTLVEAGYGLEWIQAIDQFRWSTHIELVANFSRKNRYTALTAKPEIFRD